MLQAGKLRNFVSFYKKVTVRTPTGAVKQNELQHHVGVFANLEPLSGKDIINAKAQGVELTARCQMRYRDDIAVDMLLCHNNIWYQVESILPDKVNGKVYLTLMLKSVKSDRQN